MPHVRSPSGQATVRAKITETTPRTVPGHGKDRPQGSVRTFFGACSYSRASMATASRSRSM